MAPMMNALVRANAWGRRHRRWLAAASAVSFWLVCADYARFIDLPTVVTVPVMVTGILTGLRYALWEGWLRGKLAKREEAGGHASRGE